MSSIILYGLIMVILLILSGLLSGAETAFFTIQSRITDYGEANDDVSASTMQLLEKPRQLLISLLTGNTLVNISMAFFAALITSQMANQVNIKLPLLLLIESIIVSAMILLFGEVMPKMLAIRHSETFARFASWPVRVLVILLYPVGRVIYGLIRAITRVLGIKPEAMFTSEEEMKELADVGLQRGTLAETETKIIQSIFEFTDTQVHEIMTPRVDIIGLEASEPLPAAIEIVRDQHVSAIPIFKETIDDVRGILFAKDILSFLDATHPDVKIIRLARPPFFVPESKDVVSLLQDFKDRRTSLAIVVDEFGGTAGLVTVEDVVEEVLGELRDPYDQEENDIFDDGSGNLVVNASVTLDDLSEYTGIAFPENVDYDTLGGFLFDTFDNIPAVEQSIEFEGRQFTVKGLDGNRISKVHITGKSKESGGDGSTG